MAGVIRLSIAIPVNLFGAVCSEDVIRLSLVLFVVVMTRWFRSGLPSIRYLHTGAHIGQYVARKTMNIPAQHLTCKVALLVNTVIPAPECQWRSSTSSETQKHLFRQQLHCKHQTELGLLGRSRGSIYSFVTVSIHTRCSPNRG